MVQRWDIETNGGRERPFNGPTANQNRRKSSRGIEKKKRKAEKEGRGRYLLDGWKKLTLFLSLIDPRPRMAIFVSVSSWSLFNELPLGPSSLPTKLNYIPSIKRYNRHHETIFLLKPCHRRSLQCQWTLRSFGDVHSTLADPPFYFLLIWFFSFFCFSSVNKFYVLWDGLWSAQKCELSLWWVCLW